MIQITQLAKDSSFNGVNLISNSDPSNKLHITFNERDTANLDVQGKDLTADGLSLTSITGNSGATANGQGNFLLDTDIKGTLTKLTAGSDTLRSASSTFGSNLSVVQNRQDFTKRLVNILDTGASNLTNADLNEEAANSQALSTRQSLGISALSLAKPGAAGHPPAPALIGIGRRRRVGFGGDRAKRSPLFRWRGWRPHPTAAQPRPVASGRACP
ncbi:flagellin-like hook-associated protein FlgL [Methylorubrum extorquens]|nr:flagellin-like hook-associated protein FlgL [Methylorubrum extorquens]